MTVRIDEGTPAFQLARAIQAHHEVAQRLMREMAERHKAEVATLNSQLVAEITELFRELHVATGLPLEEDGGGHHHLDTTYLAQGVAFMAPCRENHGPDMEGFVKELVASAQRRH